MSPIYGICHKLVWKSNKFRSNPLQVSVNGGNDCCESSMPFLCAPCVISDEGVSQFDTAATVCILTHVRT